MTPEWQIIENWSINSLIEIVRMNRHIERSWFRIVERGDYIRSAGLTRPPREVLKVFKHPVLGFLGVKVRKYSMPSGGPSPYTYVSRVDLYVKGYDHLSSGPW